MNLHHHIDEDSIKLVHEFLDTENKQRLIFKKIIPRLDKTVRYTAKRCQHCYIDAIENDRKYGTCRVCMYLTCKTYKPLSFKQFVSMRLPRCWKIISGCGYDMFENIIKSKPPYLYHPKQDIVSEIRFGPMEHNYTMQEFDNLNRLLKKL